MTVLGMDWLFIGSSPSVLDTLPGVLGSLSDLTVITCNSGIKLCPRPHYYAAVDQFASHEWHDQAKEAQQHGTKLITLKRELRAQKDRKIEHFDIHIKEGREEPTRDKQGSFRYSGPFCVEFALRNGATTVHLVGFDGYRNQGDWFNPEAARSNPKRPDITHTRDNIQPRMTELANVWSDVWFIQYGEPCFEVVATNWVVSSGVKQ